MYPLINKERQLMANNSKRRKFFICLSFHILLLINDNLNRVIFQTALVIPSAMRKGGLAAFIISRFYRLVLGVFKDVQDLFASVQHLGQQGSGSLGLGLEGSGIANAGDDALS
jgi:hypothetical protein